MLNTLLAVLLALPHRPSAVTDSIPKAPDSLRVPILVYHNVQPASDGGRVRSAELTMRPEVFAAQMQYLKDNKIPVVSLGALVDALHGKGTLPPRAVVITFDDGRVNQYVNALPVLRKHGFTATFFPFTHAMDRNARYFTWAQLREMHSRKTGSLRIHAAEGSGDALDGSGVHAFTDVGDSLDHSAEC